MERKLKVRLFDSVMDSNTTDEVNEFLEEIGGSVEKVTPMWNNILGGVVYVVEYWE